MQRALSEGLEALNLICHVLFISYFAKAPKDRKCWHLSGWGGGRLGIPFVNL